MPDPVTRLNRALEGRYRIERELGEGGMATVYLADDLRHERKVALKVLKPELAAVVGAERFLAEIKTTANLQHPHILPLHDSGEAGGFLFYVMPYVEGESLRDRLEREKQLPVEEAVRIAQDVAEALQAAHEKSVIHRDIKPANILLSRGRPLVADFGIALAVSAAGGGRLTETGLSLGTPHYMSPEQATGDLSVGAATDIYALGCVLYEMLVAEPPYTGGTPQAILGKIIAGDVVSARKQRGSVPAHIDAVIRKSLEKVPADRFADCEEMTRALGDASFRHGDPGIVTTGVAGAWNRLSILTTALAALFGLTTLWLATAQESRVPASGPDVIRFALAPPEGQTLSGHLAISPDGRSVVFSASGLLYRRELDRLEAEPIPGAEQPWGAFFSPDGEWIGFVDLEDNLLKRVRVDGSGLQPLAEVPPTGRSGDWSDDGRIVFNSIGRGGLFTLPEAGGEVTPVGAYLGWLDVLPGSRAALGIDFSVQELPEEPTIVLVQLDTGEQQQLFPGQGPRYAAGRIVFWRDGGLWAVPFDLDRLEVTGDPEQLVQGVSASVNGSASFRVTDNALLYRPGGPPINTLAGMPVWVDGEGSEEPIGIEAGEYSWPRISPDGDRVAIVRIQESEDIWIHDLSTGVSTPLDLDPSVDQTPLWTPDGERVVFRSTRNGPSNLYWRRADGSDEVERLTESEMNQRPVAFTPDGGLIFEDFENVFSPHDLWSLSLDTPGAEPVRLTNGDFSEAHASISPDGRFMAYLSEEPGYPEVFVTSFPDVVGGRLISTLDVGQDISAPNADPREARAPVWSPSGDAIFYQSGLAVVRVPVSTDGGFTAGAPAVEFSTTTLWPWIGEGRHYDVHPDGRFIRIRRGVSEAPNELVVVLNWTRLLDPAGSN